jgi:hypothetical protein
MRREGGSVGSSSSNYCGGGLSAASRTSGTLAKTDRRLAEAMERLLALPPASPPTADYRPRDQPAPPLPSTLRELYDARFEVTFSLAGGVRGAGRLGAACLSHPVGEQKLNQKCGGYIPCIPVHSRAFPWAGSRGGAPVLMKLLLSDRRPRDNSQRA